LVEKINLKLIKLSLLKIDNKIDYIVSRQKNYVNSYIKNILLYKYSWIHEFYPLNSKRVLNDMKRDSK